MESRAMDHHQPDHHRRSIRLRGYDYSQAGAYFLTICTHNRACLFGDIANGEMALNEAGRIASQCWRAIPDHFPHATLDEFVVMPDHIHGIVVIVDDDTVRANDNPDAGAISGSDVGAKNFSPLHKNFSPLPHGTSKTIGSIVRGFKIGVTKWMRQNTTVRDVWQRNYYEHIIRNETELHRIRQYIVENPSNWTRITNCSDAT